MIKCKICGERTHFIESHLGEAHPKMKIDQDKKSFPGAKLWSAAAEKYAGQDNRKGQVINYVRVSSIDQNEDRQLDALPKADKAFTDKASGSSTKRPALREMIDYIRKGDHIYVLSIDRLARNIEDLHRIVKQIKEKEAIVTFQKENLTYGNGDDNAMSDLLFNILGSFAQFERSMIKERQREGIAAAKARGKKLGRPSTLTDEDRQEIVKLHAEGRSKSALSRQFGVSRATILNINKAAGVTYGS
jgi:DNA invertase Pin-like site-specific DNA recombinase